MIEENLSFTDESQAMERAGFRVKEILGDNLILKLLMQMIFQKY